jgi:hypothetical protein
MNVDGFTVFWLLTALIISGTVMLSLANWSGFTQMRMAYCPAPKTCTCETPGTRLRASLKLVECLPFRCRLWLGGSAGFPLEECGRGPQAAPA